jgi:hypothetical protein
MKIRQMQTNFSRKPLVLRNERAARRLGWTPESRVTWREFLEQYPYQAAEIAAAARQDLSTAA